MTNETNAAPSTSEAMRAAAEEIANVPTRNAYASDEVHLQVIVAILSRFFGKEGTGGVLDRICAEFQAYWDEHVELKERASAHPVTEIEERIKEIINTARSAAPASPSPGEPRVCMKCGHNGEYLDKAGRCWAIKGDNHCLCTCVFEAAALHTSVEGESE